MRFTVNAPLKHFTGNVVGIDFVDGAGEFDTSNDAGRSAFAYFERAGYRMDPIDDEVLSPVEDDGDDDLFDPSAHSVDDVLAYLDAADLDEAVRVLDAEAADGGKGRVTITGKREAILAAKTPTPAAATDPNGASE